MGIFLHQKFFSAIAYTSFSKIRRLQNFIEVVVHTEALWHYYFLFSLNEKTVERGRDSANVRVRHVFF
jgi:hypothetical protein